MRHLRSLQRIVNRSFNTTTRQMGNKVPENQKLFQEDNGLPVHIKGGSTDVLLYRFTMTITIAGCGFSFYWLLTACQPRNK
ncbi:cytochrome c oxidase subunit 7A2, mitochondrial-like [Arapaima gigas]